MGGVSYADLATRIECHLVSVSQRPDPPLAGACGIDVRLLHPDKQPADRQDHDPGCDTQPISEGKPLGADPSALTDFVGMRQGLGAKFENLWGIRMLREKSPVLLYLLPGCRIARVFGEPCGEFRAAFQVMFRQPNAPGCSLGEAGCVALTHARTAWPDGPRPLRRASRRCSAQYRKERQCPSASYSRAGTR